MIFKFHAFLKAFQHLFRHSREEWLVTAARLEREALLKWLDTSEEGLFDREAEDRLALLSRKEGEGTMARVLRRDRRSSVPREIAEVFSVNLAGNGTQRREIGVGELVPGDLVELRAGDVVPLDVRLLSCDDFHVDQSAFTGIVMPVRKYAGIGEGRDLLDFPNIALRGTRVTRGVALAVIVAGGPVRMKKVATHRELGNFSAYGFLVPQR